MTTKTIFLFQLEVQLYFLIFFVFFNYVIGSDFLRNKEKKEHDERAESFWKIFEYVILNFGLRIEPRHGVP